MRSWIVRHWRGELGPAVSWWVNCVGLTVALWFAVPRLAAAGGFGIADTEATFIAGGCLRLVQLGLVPLWQLVGLWRSGSTQLRIPGHSLRARLTQVAAFVFTLLIAMRSLVFASEEIIGARVAFAIGSYEYSVTLLPGGREIAVDGGLGFGVADAVQALLDANAAVRRVRLHSGGGALSEGVKLRRVILARDLDTYADQECSSACVSAFVGGRFRYLKRGARMGFHLPRNWDTFRRGPVASPYVGELLYMRQHGLPDWFLDSWIRTGQKFWYPTEFQLVQSGLVTSLLGAPPVQPDRAPSRTPG